MTLAAERTCLTLDLYLFKTNFTFMVYSERVSHVECHMLYIGVLYDFLSTNNLRHSTNLEPLSLTKIQTIL